MGWVEYYCLYGSVPLFSNVKICHFCFTINIIFLHNLCYYFHLLENHQEANSGICNTMFTSMLLNQGRSRVLVILTQLQYIIQYVPMKMKEGGGIIVYSRINLETVTELIVSDHNGLILIHQPNYNSEGRGSSERREITPHAMHNQEHIVLTKH